MSPLFRSPFASRTAAPTASVGGGTVTAPVPATPAVPAAPTATGIHDVFVARQPIFDAKDRLYAYELL